MVRYHWQPIEDCPENIPVWVKVYDDLGERGVIKVIRRGKLFFYENYEGYIRYYPNYFSAIYE